MKPSALAVVLLPLAALGTARADTPPPSGVVNVTASATVEVPKDMMSITLTTTREGTEPSVVQTGLKQALDAALTEARRSANPGQVDVQTGNFSLYPRYNNKGLISGWQGTAQLLVEGRDMPAIGQLVGRISTMTVGRVAYGLSRETRDKTEGDVTAQAIARYRHKADDYAKQFGYAGYTLREVNVMANEPPSGVVMQMARSASIAQGEDSGLPVEAGKAVVTVTVAGTVQLNR